MNATHDWYDVTRLTDGSYRIDEAEDYGLFLVEGRDRSVVIDAGIGVGDLAGLAADLVGTPITLVLTHTHWDHIGAAAGFDDVLAPPGELPPDGRVAIDSLSDEFTQRPAQFSREWLDAGKAVPDDFDPSTYGIEPAAAEPAPMDAGLDLGDRTLEFVPLPGHSPGHLGVLDPATGVLYGGDVVHFDHGLYVMFEDCDLEDYVHSMGRVRDLRDAGRFDVLATSHNEPMSGDDLSLIDDLHEGLREIAAGTRDYELVESEWGTVRSYDVAGSEVQTRHE